MAENLKARIRVKELYMANPFETKEAASTASWGGQLPLTLRDDELLITEGDPEEDPLYSHENDVPEEVDFTGTGLTLSGAFIKATRAELASLMGGSGTDKYEHPATKLQLEKALKAVCYDGTEVIMPRAQGYVNMNLSLGKGGVTKFPFRFKLLKASADWDCDIMF